MTETLSREVPVVPKETALLFVDVQNFCANRKGSEYGKLPAPEFEERVGFYFREMEGKVVPNMQRLQKGCRAAGIEVMYTTIESLTKDGRDRSLDHKISRLHFAKGSHEAKIISAVGPVGDEIHIPKTSSGIFNSTNIEYVLRNLGIEYLVIYGIMTDQCVECAIRDAADRGFLVTQVEDACTAEDPARHATSLETMRGHYCRTRTTKQMIDEITSLS